MNQRSFLVCSTIIVLLLVLAVGAGQWPGEAGAKVPHTASRASHGRVKRGGTIQPASGAGMAPVLNTGTITGAARRIR